ncbi:MAG: four helix bundle protein [Candidatus Aenigmatarchaeota archaeon]
MDKYELQSRTKKIALEIICLTETFPKNSASFVIEKQIIRSATSVAANYRSLTRAKSKADFINKLCIIEEEADETLFWLELIKELNIANNDKIDILYKETNEILSIIVSAKKTMKNKSNL